MPESDCLVSVVVPLSNDEASVEAFVSAVTGVLRPNYAYYELVLVDDGSSDGTVDKVSALLATVEGIRLIRLSRKFGTEIAIASGLSAVIGDFVVVMLPEPGLVELIPEMVRRAQGGHDVVFGVRRSRRGDPRWLKVGASFFYWFCIKVLGLDIPQNASEFQVLSRRAVNAILQIKDKYRYLHILSAYVGYVREYFAYELESGHGRRRTRGLVEAMNLAIGIIVTNSIRPLRLVGWLAACVSALSGMYFGYVAVLRILGRQTGEAWGTVALLTAGMFSLVLMVLAVLSEYVGRILDESRDRPLYHIREEKTSSVLLTDRGRGNVVMASLQTDGGGLREASSQGAPIQTAVR